MEYALVIGVIVFLLVVGLYGYARGLVNILLSMIAMIITVVLATALTIPVGSALKATTPVYDKMYEAISQTVTDNNVVDTNTLTNLNLPKQLREKIADESDKAVSNFEEYVSTQITDTAFNASVFLALFIVIYIIIKIVIHILDFVAKLPLLKEINKLGGFALGLIVGLIILWAACLIVTTCSAKPWAQDVFAAINKNAFLGFIYNNNLIVWLITSVL